MKCDELKAQLVTIKGLGGAEYQKYVYLKGPMDAAIAELKQKLHDAEMCADLAEAANTEYRLDIEKLNDENRRLRRALYKACANWAHIAVAFFSSYATKDKWNKMKRKCLKKAEEYE